MAVYVAVSTVTRDGYGGLAEAIRFLALAYASLLLHELSHAAAACLRGVRTTEIGLWAFGGAAKIERAPDRLMDEVIIVAAGPAANVLLGTAAALASKSGGMGHEFIRELAVVNIALAILNLLPIFPLDGGRLLHAASGRFLPSSLASRATAAVSQVVSLVLLAVLAKAGWYLEALFCAAPFLLSPKSLAVHVFWFVQRRPPSQPS